MFDLREGFERGEGGNLPSPPMAFFNIDIVDMFHHILTFHTSGDTLPAVFNLCLRFVIHDMKFVNTFKVS